MPAMALAVATWVSTTQPSPLHPTSLAQVVLYVCFAYLSPWRAVQYLHLQGRSQDGSGAAWVQQRT